MRGTPEQASQRQLAGGIIPADAGNTVGLDLKLPDAQDHPRGCGEHTSCWSIVMRALGSSPRMRGTRWRWSHCRPAAQDHPRGCGEPQAQTSGHTGSRIIPADAGNTKTVTVDSPVWEDHPRGCGEHIFSASASLSIWGSSPRMWGTLIGLAYAVPVGRIIPADAGNTLSVWG